MLRGRKVPSHELCNIVGMGYSSSSQAILRVTCWAPRMIEGFAEQSMPKESNCTCRTITVLRPGTVAGSEHSMMNLINTKYEVVLSQKYYRMLVILKNAKLVAVGRYKIKSQFC